jgi:hypothetical protein
VEQFECGGVVTSEVQYLRVKSRVKSVEGCVGLPLLVAICLQPLALQAVSHS